MRGFPWRIICDSWRVSYEELADKRVIEPLLATGKTFVIPSTRRRKEPRSIDRYLYKARHLIENFYCKLKQLRAVATRYDKTARNFLAAIQLVAATTWLN